MEVARDAAEAAQLPMIDIAERDMDVELSACGVDVIALVVNDLVASAQAVERER